MRAMLVIIVMLFLVASNTFAAEVKNVTAKQDGNRIVYEYDLVGDEGEAEVTVTLTIRGKEYKSKALHLEGDVGKVRPGSGKKVWWNVLQDFPRGFSGEYEYEIVAGAKAGDIYKDAVTGIELVYVKGGCYQMGDKFGDGDSDEKPVHEVCVDDFWIGINEVTQGQWRKIMGNNPSGFSNCGDKCPAERVSWNDVQSYIWKLNRRTGENYRLPTEAEWEYACRSGGKREKYSGGSIEDNVAWYWNNSGAKTHPFGQKSPNGLGIYDMSGNVWEWVSDWYHKDYYKYSTRNNPKGPGEDWTHLKYRVYRGGSWSIEPRHLRCANRDGYAPDYRGVSLGFRLVRTK